jgi:8-oxo-dGTP diphosphatase
MEVVCALVLDGQGRVLVAQRSSRKALAGKWEFPGGKIEPGESGPTALVREIREELGCEIEIGVALPVVRHEYPAGVIALHPFLARVASGTPSAHEHAAVRWVTLDEANTLDWAEADLPVLAAFAAGASKHVAAMATPRGVGDGSEDVV